MKISPEGISINKRFFETITILKEQKVIRGLQTFTREHGINYWNLCTARNKPDVSIIKPEWIYYLVKDFGISADWIITGRGCMFGK